MQHTVLDKSHLKVGELLMHSRLGVVKFTEECKKLEEMHGMPDSIYVSDAGEIKEVTLALVDQANK